MCGRLNLDGGTLTLDGGTRPPYNLSTGWTYPTTATLVQYDTDDTVTVALAYQPTV